MKKIIWHCDVIGCTASSENHEKWERSIEFPYWMRWWLAIPFVGLLISVVEFGDFTRHFCPKHAVLVLEAESRSIAWDEAKEWLKVNR